MKHCDQHTITFKDDKLGRDKYADFLIELARNAKSEEGSYTIAVNAPYGSGKTTLLKMMCSEIKSKYSTTNIPKPLTVVYYNAWKYDYFKEPLMPLASSLFEQDDLADRESYNNMMKAAKFIASLSNGVINHFTRIDIQDASQKAKSTSDNEKEFLQYSKAIDELCDALSEAVDEYGNDSKMLVIIDELDRCRPDFAIQTLEVSKHLLTNENIVFMYAVDMGQLQKVVEKAYGEGMDSAGYLLRFFDYITTIPKADKSKYIKAIVENIEGERYVDAVSEEMNLCCGYYDMTLRDVDRVLSAYNIMYNYFLSEYKNINAHQLYLHLLCLKYKKSSWFEGIFGLNKRNGEKVEYFFDRNNRNKGTTAYRINMILDNFGVMPIVKNGKLEFSNHVLYENRKGESKINKPVITFKEGKMCLSIVLNAVLEIIPVEDNDIFCYAVFPEDLTNYSFENELTILEYLHRKIEFFDFETGLYEKRDLE